MTTTTGAFVFRSGYTIHALTLSLPAGIITHSPWRGELSSRARAVAASAGSDGLGEAAVEPPLVQAVAAMSAVAREYAANLCGIWDLRSTGDIGAIVELFRKKRCYALLQIISGSKRVATPHEADMSAVRGKFRFQVTVPAGDVPDFIKYLRWQERVVNGT